MTIRINLALQGGGAHGAFTWGVLDRFLDEKDIEIAALSGTSAGALNAAAFKSGLVSGGRDGARTCLDALWQGVSSIGDAKMNLWLRPFLPFASAWTEAIHSSLAFSPQGMAASMFSPYSWGSNGHNPLEDVVNQMNYDDIHSPDGPQLFISATNVRTGKIKVFSGTEVTPQALLASACIPTVFRAVEITDPATGTAEAYWDGGYTGNPALFPLYDRSLPDDIVIVQINPLRRDETPNDSQEIHNRINEISFNSALMGELRSINFVHRLIADGRIEKGQMKNVLVHFIADDKLMNDMTAATKLMPSPTLLKRLKAAGRRAAGAFLRAEKANLNHRSSVKLAQLFS